MAGVLYPICPEERVCALDKIDSEPEDVGCCCCWLTRRAAAISSALVKGVTVLESFFKRPRTAAITSFVYGGESVIVLFLLHTIRQGTNNVISAGHRGPWLSCLLASRIISALVPSFQPCSENLMHIEISGRTIIGAWNKLILLPCMTFLLKTGKHGNTNVMLSRDKVLWLTDALL